MTLYQYHTNYTDYIPLAIKMTFIGRYLSLVLTLNGCFWYILRVKMFCQLEKLMYSIYRIKDMDA